MDEVRAPKKKVDRRVARTQKAIMAALDKLLAEEEVGKITVSAIAREADIDRKTFYLHYSSIEELVDKRVEQAIEQILGIACDTKNYPTFTARVHALLANIDAAIMRDLPLYKRIARYGTVDSALALVERSIRPAFENMGVNTAFASGESFCSNLRFFAAGTIALYGAWLREGKGPIDAVSRTAESAIVQGMLPDSRPLLAKSA